MPSCARTWQHWCTSGWEVTAVGQGVVTPVVVPPPSRLPHSRRQHCAQDWCDGNGVEIHVDTDPRCKEDARHLLLMLVQDPFQPFKDDARTSLTPFMITCLNLLPANRLRLGLGAHMLGIVPGKAQMSRRGGAGVKLDCYPSVLHLLKDELRGLDACGLAVQDGSTGREFTVHAKLVSVLSDLKGHQAFLNYPSGLQCLKCSMRPGRKVNSRGKNPWHNHWRLLPRHHRLRLLCFCLNHRSTRERSADEESRLRYRNQHEAATRVGNLPTKPADGSHLSPFPRKLHGRPLGWGSHGASHGCEAHEQAGN